MEVLNLGIVAHVDAGKTSLTERLLFTAGVIDSIGSVDKGDTQTDSMDLERKRGITIRSAVVALTLDDLQVNVIDTPGHSDFVAEVERALRVLDAAVLVVSAVEGVQARTRILMRSLLRLKIPVLIYVNKIDRMGARYDELLESIRQSLTPQAICMTAVSGLGTRDAKAVSLETTNQDFADSLAEALAERNEGFLDRYLDSDAQLTDHEIRAELARQTRHAWIYPVYFGSAITGEGVQALVDGLRGLLQHDDQNLEDSLRATVFKIERGRSGEKVAFVRVHSGSLGRGDRVPVFRREAGGVAELEGRLGSVGRFTRGTSLEEGRAGPGSIAKVWGLAEARIGDQIGTAEGLPTKGMFAPPTLETVVRPAVGGSRPALHAALQRLAEQDPLIDVHLDEFLNEISIRLFGEVQKEVIASTLKDQYGVEVIFEQSRTLYVERPLGKGEALAEISMDSVNFFWATVGLRLRPAPEGAGIKFSLAVELGSLPLAFHKAIEESVHRTLRQGLCGWEVIDVDVVLTRTGYASPVSAAGDFRNATPLVLGEALKQAGTQVLEPLHRFELEAPTHQMSTVLAALSNVGAVTDDHDSQGRVSVLRGLIPASAVHTLSEQMPELTSGEGLLTTEFDRYRPFRGIPPVRARRGPNPYNREQYMLHVLGRVP